MNRSYKSIYNEQTGAWVAVSEITAARGKKSTTKAIVTAAATISALGVSLQTQAQIAIGAQPAGVAGSSIASGLDSVVYGERSTAYGVNSVVLGTEAFSYNSNDLSIGYMAGKGSIPGPGGNVPEPTILIGSEAGAYSSNGGSDVYVGHNTGRS